MIAVPDFVQSHPLWAGDMLQRRHSINRLTRRDVVHAHSALLAHPCDSDTLFTWRVMLDWWLWGIPTFPPMDRVDRMIRLAESHYTDFEIQALRRTQKWAGYRRMYESFASFARRAA